VLTRKIMLLGEIAVGKTSIARRLIFDRFETDYKATLGVDIYAHDTVPPDAPDCPVRLMLWDIDGDIGESIFNHIYIRGASGALIIGDATRPATMATMIRLAEGCRSTLLGRPVFYVINKSDLLDGDRNFEMPEALHDPNIELHITSAKSGRNVATVFAGMAAAIVRTGL
jgi:GTPase SAR1 family protein